MKEDSTVAETVDFAQLRALVTIEMVLLEYYGLTNLRQQGSKLIGPCPVHGGDSPRAFHASIEKNVWKCFTRCQAPSGGDILDLVSRIDGVSLREAGLALKRHFAHRFGVETPRTTASRPSTKTTAPTATTTQTDANPVLTVNLRLGADHPHLRQRGLSQETIAHFGVGHCARGIMRGCIAIPIHNLDGELVAYAGRRLRPQDVATYGKYKLPKGFRKELELFNFHRAREAMEEHGLIVVEGYFSVMKLYEAGLSNVVATMGVECSLAQADLLAQAPELLVLFDGNDAGYAGAQALKQKLQDRTRVRVARLPEGVEPDDLAPRALRWLVNGMRQLNLPEVHLWTTAEEPTE